MKSNLTPEGEVYVDALIASVEAAEPLAAPTVHTLANVPVERVAWLWPGYLPAGKLVVLDGDPSVGKSTLTTDLAARCSTGERWPDSAVNSGPRDVLLLSAEDGLGDTIAPRLTAAGADLSRVHALTEVPQVSDGGGVRMVPPSLPRDIPHVERVIREHRVALVVVDVLMAYLTGKVDSHRDQDVRGVLHQLAAMAERTGCSILLIRHLNKAGGGSPLYRGGGSIGIIGAARAAYIVGRDPEDPDRRILACSKLNLAVEPSTLAYRLVSDTDLGCARVEWETGPVEGMTAARLLSGPMDDDERAARDAAAEWLDAYLADNGGEATANDVYREGDKAGFSRDQLKRSKNRAGILSAKSSLRGGWVWRLDTAREGSTKGAKGAHSESSLPSTPSALPSVNDCSVCGDPLHPALEAEGATTHPTCSEVTR